MKNIIYFKNKQRNDKRNKKKKNFFAAIVNDEFKYFSLLNDFIKL